MIYQPPGDKFAYCGAVREVATAPVIGRGGINHPELARRGLDEGWIKPLSPAMRVCGPAFPVRSPPGDNLWLHRAIYAASAGDVLVVDTQGGEDFSHWGEIMTIAAQLRSIAGLVIAGGVRDRERLIDMGFPVFGAAICIRGTAKDPHGNGALGERVKIGDVLISRGDLVLGDADGVASIPANQAAQAVARAHARDAEEERIVERLRSGETTIGIYRLPE